MCYLECYLMKFKQKLAKLLSSVGRLTGHMTANQGPGFWVVTLIMIAITISQCDDICTKKIDGECFIPVRSAPIVRSAPMVGSALMERSDGPEHSNHFYLSNCSDHFDHSSRYNQCYTIVSITLCCIQMPPVQIFPSCASPQGRSRVHNNSNNLLACLMFSYLMLSY